MSKNLKHIIWDWNGTLLDDRAVTLRMVNEILTMHGVDPVDLERHRQNFTIPVRRYYEKLGVDLNAVPWEPINDLFHQRYTEALDEPPLFSAVRAALAYFEQQNLPQSILSSLGHGLLVRQVQTRGISKYFETISGHTGEPGTSKLAHGRDLAAATKLSPDKILLIGDTDHDFEVAEAIGVQCILVADGHQSKERLLATRAPVIDNLEQLSAKIEEIHGR